MALERNGSSRSAFFAAMSDENNEAKCSRSSEGNASPPPEGRHQASCEDTAAKTIHFLRARLLAERATSKAAKDCAEQNAKRWREEVCCSSHVLELEKMLELEVELKNKAEAAMQEMLAKLREAENSVGSSHLSPVQTKQEKPIKTEDIVYVEDVASPNSTCTAGIADAEVQNPSLNDMPQDGSSSSNSNESQPLEQRRERSNALNTDGVTLDEYQQSTGSVMEEGQVSNQNKVENDEGREASNDLDAHGPTLDKYQQNTDSILEESQLPVQNKVDNDERRRGSNDVNTESTILDEYQQDTCCTVEEDQLSNQNKVDNDNNAILSNLIPPLQEENSSSADHGDSLQQDKESSKEGYACQNSATYENLIDGDVSINPRTRIEASLRELCNQVGKEVAAPESQNQNEFVRLKLHELVDQIVGTADGQLHKHNTATLQASSQCSKSSVLGCADIQQNLYKNNIGAGKLQMELAGKGQHIMGDMEASKSFDSNAACDSRHHTERAAAACTNGSISTRHANGNQHVRHYHAARDNLYSLQCSDCSDAFLTGKEVPCVRGHGSCVQKQMPNVQSCLETSKTGVNLQCRSMPELCCDDCFKELHVKTNCLVCKAAPHDRLYCNNEKTIQVKRNCGHNQAAISMGLGTFWDLSSSSRSEGFMPRHCGFLNTNSLIQNQYARVYERREIMPGRSFCSEETPAPLRSFHDCLSVQCQQGSSYVSDSYGNERNMKVYTEHGPIPLISMQWGLRGSPLNSEQFQSSQMGKVEDVLIALRHAKEDIQTAIDKAHHSNV